METNITAGIIQKSVILNAYAVTFTVTGRGLNLAVGGRAFLEEENSGCVLASDIIAFRRVTGHINADDIYLVDVRRIPPLNLRISGKPGSPIVFHSKITD